MTDQTKREEPPLVLSLSQAADLLGMKRPNVSKFLARRGVRPYLRKASGYFWLESDVLRAKREREADEAQMKADAKRRASALRRQGQEPEPEVEVPEGAERLGERQKAVLRALSARPLRSENEATRAAFRRLSQRGLAEQVAGEPGLWALTEKGQTVSAAL